MTKTSELARQAGVTVRTLRYYDRIGLLVARRTGTGHRVYSPDDLVRLQQIRLLQFLGLTLEQIRRLLREPRNLRQSLDLQLQVLQQKQAQLSRLIGILEDASRQDCDLARVTESIEREIAMDWNKKFYDDDTWEKVSQRAGRYSPEQQAADARRWQDLYCEARERMGEPLQSEPVRALALRFKELIEEFTGGDPKILQALRAMQAEGGGGPAGLPDNSVVKSFLGEAVKANNLALK